MKDYDDTSIMISIKEYEYDDLDITSDYMNFNVAFGITRYDGSSASIEDPDYGVVNAYYRNWGVKDDLHVYTDPIETRPCTYSDFGLDENGEVISNDTLTDYVDEDNSKPPTFFPLIDQ